MMRILIYYFNLLSAKFYAIAMKLPIISVPGIM